MKRNYKKQKGFTLIEVLVALTIFMIFIVSITRSYLDIAQSQRESNAVREIYSEMRYIYSLISEEARSKTIDYGCPASSDTQGDSFVSQSSACSDLMNVERQNYLALISGDGTQRTVFKIEDDLTTGEKAFFIAKENFTGVTWEPAEGHRQNTFVQLELNYVKINGFEFGIAPLADPFASANVACGPVQFQPSVSIYSSIEGKQRNVSNFKLDLQTTISSRVYNKQTQT